MMIIDSSIRLNKLAVKLIRLTIIVMVMVVKLVLIGFAVGRLHYSDLQVHVYDLVHLVDYHNNNHLDWIELETDFSDEKLQKLHQVQSIHHQ